MAIPYNFPANLTCELVNFMKMQIVVLLVCMESKICNLRKIDWYLKGILKYWLHNGNAKLIENQDKLTRLIGIHKKYQNISL